jgi:centromere/kinetochore protein ZW10
VGAIVEVSLQRILENILAIPDIPEVESHKLSELCRILAALEGLFVEDFNEVCLLCLAFSR